ncbi:hypothetical protein NPJ88_006490 [Halomonas elongata]|uniref:hypothetical protein n=1 Tax=Halomonas elongata TaxID=2746 RepID=UPI00255AC684|nr:hypothetical protein [Halomonas elongata]MDL4861974.1 hypothetical protein [Halomonas elongata]
MSRIDHAIIEDALTDHENALSALTALTRVLDNHQAELDCDEGLTFDSFTMGGILEALRITASHLDNIGHRIEKATRQGGAQ